MTTDNDKSLRDHLLSLIGGANAHISFDDFIKDFPAEKCGEKIAGLPYTAWQVLEHMRIAQWDILEFSRDAKHISPKWPEGYWPKRDEVGDLIANSATDLFARIPHGSGQTILREALLVADHNAYHLGVLVAINRMLKK